MIYTMSFDITGVAIPKKLVDVGNRIARVKMQVIDTSILFFNKNRDLLLQTVGGNIQGLQLIQQDRIYSDWVTGEIWGISNVNGGQVAVIIEVMPSSFNVADLMPGIGAEECVPCGDSLES